MSDLDHAVILLGRAVADATALAGMREHPAAFDNEIFGFHAQQAVEKALKAWIAAINHDYPLTHNLSVLLNILAEAGEDVEPFRLIAKLTPFAVQFRYEPEAENETLDRDVWLTDVEAIVSHVRRTLDQRGPHSADDPA